MNLKVSEKIRKLCKSKFPKTHYILDFVQALLIHISRVGSKKKHSKHDIWETNSSNSKEDIKLLLFEFEQNLNN